MSPVEQHCRICDGVLRHPFVDLGASPLCESYLDASQLGAMEPFYPLCPYVCESCFLVQLQEFVAPEDIFTEYAYFSSYSDSWLRHAEEYVEMAMARFGLGAGSHVVEVASNDGYLLQYFVARGVPVLGIEPAANVAEAAERRGVPTEVCFFNEDTARDLVARGQRADLLAGNNVLAQVPDLKGFVRGLTILLAPRGVLTLEFPHLLRLMRENQFDTIYHEHFSYFSLRTVAEFFTREGLTVFDVEELATHGGSLRVFARHADDDSQAVGERVTALLAVEEEAGLGRLETYTSFAEQVKETKRKLLEFLITAKRDGKRVVGYGAPGKGNTLLNYCGIGTDFLDFTVDRNPYKQGKFTPGTRIPIFPPEKLREAKPDYVFILPWNLKDEIMEQQSFIREWGGRFIVPIPEVQVHA
jgi:2-polyprenyl-3-methyl-5-hydroxy-6-metoxy-1,4-benzoquinol methylase